jgi:hypothetical protein
LAALRFMLPDMSSWKLASAIAIMSLAGCGSQPTYTEAPALPEPEEESEADQSEPVESEAAESEAAEPEPSLPPLPPKKECSGLPKSTCEVTEGCAWSTTKDCIEQ